MFPGCFFYCQRPSHELQAARTSLTGVHHCFSELSAEMKKYLGVNAGSIYILPWHLTNHTGQIPIRAVTKFTDLIQAMQSLAEDICHLNTGDKQQILRHAHHNAQTQTQNVLWNMFTEKKFKDPRGFFGFDMSFDLITDYFKSAETGLDPSALMNFFQAFPLSEAPPRFLAYNSGLTTLNAIKTRGPIFALTITMAEGLTSMLAALKPTIMGPDPFHGIMGHAELHFGSPALEKLAKELFTVKAFDPLALAFFQKLELPSTDLQQTLASLPTTIFDKIVIDVDERKTLLNTLSTFKIKPGGWWSDEAVSDEIKLKIIKVIKSIQERGRAPQNKDVLLIYKYIAATHFILRKQDGRLAIDDVQLDTFMSHQEGLARFTTDCIEKVMQTVLRYDEKDPNSNPNNFCCIFHEEAIAFFREEDILNEELQQAIKILRHLLHQEFTDEAVTQVIDYVTENKTSPDNFERLTLYQNLAAAVFVKRAIQHTQENGLHGHTDISLYIYTQLSDLVASSSDAAKGSVVELGGKLNSLIITKTQTVFDHHKASCVAKGIDFSRQPFPFLGSFTADGRDFTTGPVIKLLKASAGKLSTAAIELARIDRKLIAAAQGQRQGIIDDLMAQWSQACENTLGEMEPELELLTKLQQMCHLLIKETLLYGNTETSFVAQLNRNLPELLSEYSQCTVPRDMRSVTGLLSYYYQQGVKKMRLDKKVESFGREWKEASGVEQQGRLAQLCAEGHVSMRYMPRAPAQYQVVNVEKLREDIARRESALREGDKVTEMFSRCSLYQLESILSTRESAVILANLLKTMKIDAIRFFNSTFLDNGDETPWVGDNICPFLRHTSTLNPKTTNFRKVFQERLNRLLLTEDRQRIKTEITSIKEYINICSEMYTKQVDCLIHFFPLDFMDKAKKLLIGMDIIQSDSKKSNIRELKSTIREFMEISEDVLNNEPIFLDGTRALSPKDRVKCYRHDRFYQRGAGVLSGRTFSN